MANFKSSKPSKAAPAPAPAAKPAVKPPVKASAAPAPAKALAPYEPTQEEIQTRAFEIYLSEGCKEGNDLEYWLRAEQELRR
jgi:Protein of unknown function (DUF2934)